MPIDFPTIDQLPDETRRIIDELKAKDLPRRPKVDPETDVVRRHYKKMLQPENLKKAKAEDLKALANSQKAGSTGNQQSFNVYWNKLGDERAADEMRSALEYLLYGDGVVEDRLTELINGTSEHAMTGLKEGICVKTLVMAQPDRFLPILYYSGTAGKKEIAQGLFQIQFPDPDRSKHPIGELIVASNDLLVEIVRPEYGDLEMAGGFLWDAYHHISPPNPAARKKGVVAPLDDSREFRCTLCNIIKPTRLLARKDPAVCQDCA